MHLLVASYLDYQAPADDDPDTADAADSADTAGPGRAEWMQGMGGIPASDALRQARTPAEALAAAERLFFGELMEI